MGISLIKIIVGLLLLYIGAEGLVLASSSLALRLRVSPLMIGLTIVACGTSMPELIVSLKTALSGQGSITIGNVVGSNIFNIAVILGLSALIYPLKVNIKLIRLDTPIMILAALIFGLLFYDMHLSRFEGLILLLLVILYTFINFYMARNASKKDIVQIKKETLSSKPLGNIYHETIILIAGFFILICGANYLVDGSIRLAGIIGVSEAIIGLTVIAAGTSWPELATSIVAAFRKHPDIAVGNIIGSNIFNIFGILGISSLLSPITGAGINFVDVYVMIALSIILLPLMWSGFELKRWEGLVLIGGYIGYIYHLIR
ncbi:MAG TPA: calcium/sodium antiporter [Desulfatiglandales bacterium]|nr:calcium/sodium antiporter [Desulfatiglandales bacterium]